MPTPPKSQIVLMVVMMGWKYLDVDVGPGTPGLIYLRFFYGAGMVLTACCFGALYLKISAMPMDPKTKVKVTIEEPMKPKRIEEITLPEHDMREWKKMLTQSAASMVLIPLMHYKWEYTIPLVIQGVSGPLMLLSHSLSQVHLFGQPAEGALARPWKPPPTPFDGLKKAFEEPEAAAAPAEQAAGDAGGDAKKGSSKKKK